MKKASIAFATIVAGVLPLLLAVGSASSVAGERVAATFDLGPHLGRTLKMARDGAPVALADTVVRATFIDPRPNQPQIEKIIFDGSYHPSAGRYAEFWVKTAVRVKGTARSLSETALCNWNHPKSTATCHVENDGGRFQIRALRPASGSNALFKFVVGPLDDYRGFRIAEDVSRQGEPISYDVELIDSSGVEIPLRMQGK
jgi:hypothetical protein